MSAALAPGEVASGLARLRAAHMHQLASVIERSAVMTAGGVIPTPEERVRLDPYVRVLGSVADMDGSAVHVGVNYDTVSVSNAVDSVFTREGTAELLRLIAVACWEAGANKRRMDAEVSDGS